MKFKLQVSLFCFMLAATSLHGQSADEGKAIAEKLLTKYPKLKQSLVSGDVRPKPDGFEMDGNPATYPVAGFILPVTDWNALTKVQQISLTMYVESRVAFIRQHAKSYMLTPSSAPSYQEELNVLKHLPNDAWYIGTTIENGGQLYLDHKLVHGDGAWNHDPSKEGIKVSDFRK